MVSSDSRASRPPRPRGRPRSFDRATALEKALMAFWENGYEATSVSDLTRAMDIGAPSLYAAFGDKRSLFEEVVQVYGARYGAFTERALAEEPTARAAVERTLREAAVEYTAPGRPTAASSSTRPPTAPPRRSSGPCASGATRTSRRSKAVSGPTSPRVSCRRRPTPPRSPGTPGR